MLHILEEPAVAGTYLWGRWSAKRKKRRDERDWLQLKVEPIVEPALHELAIALRRQHEPKRNPGRPVAPANLRAVLEYIASAVCAPERCDALGRALGRSASVDGMELPRAWSTLVTAAGIVSRNYLRHLIERIEVMENQITIVPRADFPVSDENAAIHGSR